MVARLIRTDREISENDIRAYAEISSDDWDQAMAYEASKNAPRRPMGGSSAAPAQSQPSGHPQSQPSGHPANIPKSGGHPEGISPKVGSVPPEIGSIAPEIGSIAPEAGSLAPEVGSLAPEVGSIAPKVGSIAPEAGSLAPEVGSIAPEVGSLAPEAGSVPPEIGSVSPKAGSVPAEVGSIPKREQRGRPSESAPQAAEYTKAQKEYYTAILDLKRTFENVGNYRQYLRTGPQTELDMIVNALAGGCLRPRFRTQADRFGRTGASARGCGLTDKENMEIITKKGNKIERYTLSQQQDGKNGAKGRRLGTAYELENGEIIYVED